MFNFPDNPTNGQQVTGPTGIVYTWDGTKWITSPSSTSATFLPLAGGAMSGPLILAADPTAALGSATKQYVDVEDNTILGLGVGLGGFINKFRNSKFDIWQRGLGPLTTGVGVLTYTADGWMVIASGAAVQVAASGGRTNGLGGNALSITGASGNTGVSIIQRIESNDAAVFTGQRVTFQGWFYNSTGAVVTPLLIVAVPAGTDNWPVSPTQILNVPLQSCPNGQWTRVAYTFDVGNNRVNIGIAFVIQISAIVSGTFSLTEMDVRVTPGVSVGLNNNPPPPEFRPMAVEFVYCQRYYQGFNGVLLVYNSGVGSYGGAVCPIMFPVRMRALPTSTVANGTTGGGFVGNPQISVQSSGYLLAVCASPQTTIGAYMNFSGTLSADL